MIRLLNGGLSMQENAESRQECGVCNGTGMLCCSLSVAWLSLLLQDAYRSNFWLNALPEIHKRHRLSSPGADAMQS